MRTLNIHSNHTKKKIPFPSTWPQCNCSVGRSGILRSWGSRWQDLAAARSPVTLDSVAAQISRAVWKFCLPCTAVCFCDLEDGYEVWRWSQPHCSCDEMVAWAGSVRLGEWNLTVAFMGHIPPSKLISSSCFGMESNGWHPLELYYPLKM